MNPSFQMGFNIHNSSPAGLVRVTTSSATNISPSLAVSLLHPTNPALYANSCVRRDAHWAQVSISSSIKGTSRSLVATEGPARTRDPRSPCHTKSQRTSYTDNPQTHSGRMEGISDSGNDIEPWSYSLARSPPCQEIPFEWRNAGCIA